LKVAIADTNEAELQSLGKQLVEQIGEANVLVIPTDVSKLDQVESLKTKVYEDWGEVRSPSFFLSANSFFYYPSTLYALPFDSEVTTRVIGRIDGRINPYRYSIRDCLLSVYHCFSNTIFAL
jgi:NAD(P)-dependent dehydrogenase (short-subunit alcohol dehydrogenase family)